MSWFRKSRRSFEGAYYKHQANGKSLAIIPVRAGEGAFIQVITDNRSYNVPDDGGSTFSEQGISLNIRRPELTLTGRIRYSGLTPVRGDIMGPFRFFPMECRHAVVSMRHGLEGAVRLNGEILDFSGGIGYIEADSGRSFPESYSWVHCNDFARECSVMASVARIPFCGLRFWGCVCVVWLEGREYRLATYKGVRILRCAEGELELKQGEYRLSVKVWASGGHELAAPRSGVMTRVIRENLSCPAEFRFMKKDQVLFEGKSGHASYEYIVK